MAEQTTTTNALAPVKQKIDVFMDKPKVRKAMDWMGKNAHSFSRIAICCYFLNFAYTELYKYFYYNMGGSPLESLVVLPCCILVILNKGVKFAGFILMLFSLYHSGETTLTQLSYWWQGFGFYFNELMVKRVAVTGCFGLVYGKCLLEMKSDDSTGLTGLLLEAKRDTMSSRHSGILLIARLFISILFLFVGYSEIKRQLETHYLDAQGHDHSRRREGDGHDELWGKVFQFAFSLPMMVGFKNKIVALLMSVVCMGEALMMWKWWSESAARLGLGYQLHAREHFYVNVAVAGGLLLLHEFGAGKYSVDAYLKSKKNN